MAPPITIREKRQIIAANYARWWGWSFELAGVVLGKLIDCRCEEMFWDSYQVVDNDLGDPSANLQSDAWWDRRDPIFRSLRFAWIEESMVVCRWNSDEERLHVRNLYHEPQIATWEKAVILLQKFAGVNYECDGRNDAEAECVGRRHDRT